MASAAACSLPDCSCPEIHPTLCAPSLTTPTPATSTVLAPRLTASSTWEGIIDDGRLSRGSWARRTRSELSQLAEHENCPSPVTCCCPRYKRSRRYPRLRSWEFSRSRRSCWIQLSSVTAGPRAPSLLAAAPQTRTQIVTAWASRLLAAEPPSRVTVGLSVSVGERRNCSSDLGQLGAVQIHPSTQPRL